VYAISMWAGTILVETRARAGVTQRELADLAGVPQSTVGRIEAGSIDPRASTLRRLLRAGGMDLEPALLIGLGIDRSPIRERLARTPRERLEDLASAAAGIRRLRGRARPGS